MSQVFTQEGRAVPVTVLEAGPLVVTQLKTQTADGYEAVQFGFGVRKAKNISKAVRGHVKELGNFAVLREFRIPAAEMKLGDRVTASVFAPGDVVEAPWFPRRSPLTRSEALRARARFNRRRSSYPCP
jgi:large subunit ribosomal protein L3